LNTGRGLSVQKDALSGLPPTAPPSVAGGPCVRYSRALRATRNRGAGRAFDTTDEHTPIWHRSRQPSIDCGREKGTEKLFLGGSVINAHQLGRYTESHDPVATTNGNRSGLIADVALHQAESTSDFWVSLIQIIEKSSCRQLDGARRSIAMLDEAPVLAADIMTRDVAVVHRETSLLDAVKLMAQRRISGVPVVDADGDVVGMLTEGDLLRWREGYTEKQAHWFEVLAEGQEVGSTFLEAILSQHNRVKNVMSAGAVTITEGVSAREIAALMYKRNIKRVPVVRDGKLVGIVARSDLVRAFAQALGTKSPALERTTVNEALRRAREKPAAR
jgi:CBS domain-containing protein